MKEIGGYFGLELFKGSHQYHDSAATFKSGRSALHYILSVTQPSLVYVPYYTCNALLEPFDVHGTPYVFYEISGTLEPTLLPELKENEYFLYVNYFDLKREFVNTLSEKYGERLVVDCTQAFFMKANGQSWFFNSCRKFFGVPDGSYLDVPRNINIDNFRSRNEEYLLEHLIKRFNGHTREGYEYFLNNEVLCGSELKSMSVLSETLLSQVDYSTAASTRLANYNYLHQALQATNEMELVPALGSIPMYYPYLVGRSVNRQLLYGDNIFVPTLWNDVLAREITGYDLERTITNFLLPLPIDHRYNFNDMDQILKVLKTL